MNLVFLGALSITLAITPWVNSDAMIIPKIILIFMLSLYLIPSIVKNYRIIFKDVRLRILFIISLSFVLNMALVIYLSDAPFEQEFFGRSGRGLGFVTFFSLFIIMLYTALKVTTPEISKLNKWLFASCLISSFYALLQYYNLDFFEWRTQNNGIIGTIGNPNYQSSFVAIATIPSLVYLWSQKYRILKVVIASAFFLFTLYICESTQGYIAISASTLVFILSFLWYRKNKINFFILLTLSVIMGLIVIAGMLNKGPLSYFLYKVSVRSRGEMWDTAFAIIQDKPILGVGIDSLGDYSLMYQSEKTANGIAEYIDNVHNFFFQFAATGGISLAVIYLTLIIYAGLSFVVYQRRVKRFDVNIAALMAAWVSFQLQSLISPAAIPTLIWNFIFCGVIIGITRIFNVRENSNIVLKKSLLHVDKEKDLVKLPSMVLAVLALVITAPMYNADKLARQANEKSDSLLAVEAAKRYPESVLRYNLLGAALYSAGVYDLSLEIARSAVRFNPNSYQTWILILLNPNAPIPERQVAKTRLMIIDPHNLAIRNYPLE